jgi:hypothetical protein
LEIMFLTGAIMPRHKKAPSPLFAVARSYLSQHAPAVQSAPLWLHQLDGPPGSPRFVVTAEACCTKNCPFGVTRALADAGDCPVRECALRCTVRLLFGRDGALQTATYSGVHWRESKPRAP